MQAILNILVPRAAWLYLNLVARTSTVRWIGRGSLSWLEQNHRNFVFAFWHGRQLLMLPAYRGYPARILVSQSKDGELVARAIGLFGMGTVRGSSSRGAARALVHMKQTIEEGLSISISPDGPRGPQRSVAPGVIYLAQKTGKPILPVANSTSRKFIIKNWDDYWVPLPFGRIFVGAGRPIHVSPEDNLERKSAELAAELSRLTEECDRLAARQTSTAERLCYAIYNTLLFLAAPLLIFGIFLRYPKTFAGHFTDGIAQRMGRLKKIRFFQRPHVWIHAASLGECRAALPLVKALRAKYPDRPIAFSCTAPNGLAEAKRLGMGDHYFYAPVDLPIFLRRAFDALSPSLVLLLESEIWPNWLREAEARGIPVAIVNARMSEKSAKRYAAFSGLTRHFFDKIRVVCAREDQDAARFRAAGVPPERISVAGNLKFDLAPWDLNGKTPYSSAPAARRPIFVAGSVREGEEAAVAEAFAACKKDFPELRMILAPRHTENLSSLRSALSRQAGKVALRTQTDRSDESWDVLIWDSFGDLMQAYREATVVFVGGSLVAKGGQNPIEPAWLSKPILFGPHMENFAAPARLFLEAGSALEVRDAADLASKLGALLSDPAKAAEMGKLSRRAIESWAGKATSRTIEKLSPFFT